MLDLGALLGYETTAEYSEYSEYAEEGMDGRTDITEVVIGAAIDVHRALGPGLLESTYEACLVHELLERGLSLERQKALPVTYRGVLIDCGYRIDLLVENSLIVEIEGGREGHSDSRGAAPDLPASIRLPDWVVVELQRCVDEGGYQKVRSSRLFTVASAITASSAVDPGRP